jgi:hypothetical protein
MVMGLPGLFSLAGTFFRLGNNNRICIARGRITCYISLKIPKLGKISSKKTLELRLKTAMPK